jgi:hypothetical protein
MKKEKVGRGTSIALIVSARKVNADEKAKR